MIAKTSNTPYKQRFARLLPTFLLAMLACQGVFAAAGNLADPQADKPRSAAPQAILVTGYTLQTHSNEANEALSTSKSESPAGMANIQNINSGLSKALEHIGIAAGSDEHTQAITAANHFLAETHPEHINQQRTAFATIYQTCRVSTGTALGSITFRIPEASTTAYMEEWDSRSREAYVVAFDNPSMESAESVGWQSPITLTPTGVTEKLLGLESAEFRIDAEKNSSADNTSTDSTTKSQPEPEPRADHSQAGESSIESTGKPFDSIAIAVTVNDVEKAWLAKDYQGSTIVQEFHQGFSGFLGKAKSTDAFYLSKLNTTMTLLQNGLPLRNSQTVQTSIGSKVMSSVTTLSEASGLHLIAHSHDDCGLSIIPDGYQLSRTLVIP